MLTIKHFSRITAIPETTLRYYEQEGVLLPAARTEAGYRLYGADQVLPAKFLYSLRLASVPMGEVRSYQQAEAEVRQATLEQWHRNLTERITWLTLARKYLEGLMGQGAADSIHLQVSEPERVAWFTHEAPVGKFQEPYTERCAQLRAAGAQPAQAYFRYVMERPERPGLVRGDVGFQVLGATRKLPPEARVEERPATLRLSLEHRGPIEQVPRTYERLFRFMTDQGWKLVGPMIERYPVSEPFYVEVLAPILHLEGSAPHD